MCNHPAFLPEQPGVIRMEFIAEIRRRHLVEGESISSIARSLKKSRPTVRKALTTLSEPVYQRASQPVPKLGPFQAQLVLAVSKMRGYLAALVGGEKAPLGAVWGEKTPERKGREATLWCEVMMASE
jgi:hypothetical protein